MTTEVLSADKCQSMIIPLIELTASIYEEDSTGKRMQDLSQRIVCALQTSGFLLISSPFLPIELQQSAIQVTKDIFRVTHAASSNNDTKDGIIQHPTDPKQYLLIDCHSRESIQRDLSLTTDSEHIKIISEYVEALETLKMQLLECIAIGLKLPSNNFLVDLHQKRNSALRLLHYYDVSHGAGSSKLSCTTIDEIDSPTKGSSTPETTRIRCKAHSDYGSLTLLLTDGVPGLQAFVNGQWIPVPHVEGALVVNIGSLLSEWTKGMLLATLHRVVSDMDQGNAEKTTRTSLAFFADPDPSISTTLNATRGTSLDKTASMNVSEYIQYRSGGTDAGREGVQFTTGERGRLESQDNKIGVQLQVEGAEADREELMTTLWKGALEVFVHQLLYIRKVYPRDAFCASRFLGVQCHVCRHPRMVSYVNEALQVVVTELLLKGSCNEFVVEIYDQVNMMSYEEYYISFVSHTVTVAPIEDVEKDLRDLICSVGTVGRVASSRWPDSVSFRILVQCTCQDSVSNADRPVNPNFEAKWYRAYRKNDRTEDQRRTIYDVPSCGCTFQYQIRSTDMDTGD
jgi:isopenicillin N synthase-like dioxygenase